MSDEPDDYILAPEEVQDQMEEHLFPRRVEAPDFQDQMQDIQIELDPNIGKQKPPQQRGNFVPQEVFDEDIGDAEQGPSPQDIVHQLAAQRRSSRRSRMGLPQDAQPEQAFQAQEAEMDKRMEGEGGGGQDQVAQTMQKILEEVQKGVEFLRGIEEKIDGIGGLAS